MIGNVVKIGPIPLNLEKKDLKFEDSVMSALRTQKYTLAQHIVILNDSIMLNMSTTSTIYRDSRQHYVIQFISDLQQVGGFLWILQFSSTNKTDVHNITDILLKVALNTITLKPPIYRAINLLKCNYNDVTYSS